METTNNQRNDNQPDNRMSSPENTFAGQAAPSQNQDRIDSQRGDNDDFTTNGLDEGHDEE